MLHYAIIFLGQKYILKEGFSLSIAKNKHRYLVTMSDDEWDKVIQYQEHYHIPSVSATVRSMCMGFLDLKAKEDTLNFMMDLPFWKDDFMKFYNKMRQLEAVTGQLLKKDSSDEDSENT